MLQVRWVGVMILALGSLFSSCAHSPSADYTTKELWQIASKTEKRIVWELQKEERECMIITSLFPSCSEPFYIPLGGIQGLEYQPGYEYVIEVEVTHWANPPQDSSNKSYALRQILSQVKASQE